MKVIDAISFLVYGMVRLVSFKFCVTLWHMSIGSGVAVAVALQKVDRAPHAEAGAQRHNEGL